jgi:hypothetical protein
MSVVHDATTIVSREQRDKFERDGYLVIDDTGRPESLLDAISADLHSSFAGDYRREDDGVYYSWARIMDAWKVNANVADLALSPKVFTVLEQLFGRKPLPLQTLNFEVGTEQLIHSDTWHFNAMPKGNMCGVWVALEDVHPDSGPIFFYPGSHKLPEVTPQDVGSNEEDQYSAHMAALMEREGLEPHYATIRKGQAFIWSANLAHGGSPRRNRDFTRKSQVTHFFFEGCKYYTPKLTRDDHVHWRYPAWISRDPDREVHRIRAVVADTVPQGATVLVASSNDDRLLELDGRQGWHFPQDESGAWAGYYPADGNEAITQVEKLRAKGAGYMVFPDPSLWLLDHYPELRGHLEGHYPNVIHELDCKIYALWEPRTA